MPQTQFPDVSHLSQRARLAIALHLFRGYCDRCGLTHPEIDRYLENMWEFIEIFGDAAAFGRWSQQRPVLTEVGLGDFFPVEFEILLKAAGVSEREFRAALELTTEILYVSMYGASNDKMSRQFLEQLAEIATARGVSWPDVIRFSSSPWIVGDGWGKQPSAAELSEWRRA